MEGYLSAVNPSFPMKIDFLPLKSYFDRLDRKLKDLALGTVNDDVTALVQRLMAKQETVSEKCNRILRRFFHASIVENPEIAANDWQEVAALNLLLRWFTSEEEKIEMNLAEMIGALALSKLISNIDVGHLHVLEEAEEDAIIVQDSTAEDKEVSGQELCHEAETSARDEVSSDSALSKTSRIQEVRAKLRQMVENICHETLLSRAESRMEKPKLKDYIRNDDCGKLDRISSTVNWLDDRIAPSLVDLFCVLKRCGQEIGQISRIRCTGERALNDRDKTRFFIKIVELLELADEELTRVEKRWMIKGFEEDDCHPAVTAKGVMLAEELLGQLTGVALKLNDFRGCRSMPEPWPRDIMFLETNLRRLEMEIEMIESRVDWLKSRVKDGRFIKVMVALCHAIYSIESMKV